MPISLLSDISEMMCQSLLTGICKADGFSRGCRIAWRSCEMVLIWERLWLSGRHRPEITPEVTVFAQAKDFFLVNLGVGLGPSYGLGQRF